MFEIVRKVLESADYEAERIHMDALIHKQSPDIAGTVEQSKERRAGTVSVQSGLASDAMCPLPMPSGLPSQSWYRWIPLEPGKSVRMTAIEYLKKYQPSRLKKSFARNEWELTDHDSFKVNELTSQWHWNSRDIGGTSALNLKEQKIRAARTTPRLQDGQEMPEVHPFSGRIQSQKNTLDNAEKQISTR